MSLTYYTAVGGTSSLYDRGWFLPDSPFSIYLSSLNLVPNRPDPFIWSTDLDGASVIAYLFKAKQKHTDWLSGGAALKYYLETIPLDNRNIISHSHGRQVVLYALQRGLKINRWLDISGPIREDMDHHTIEVHGNFDSMMHIYSNWDWIQILGSLFDNNVGITGFCDIADRNIKLPHRFGHSKLFHPDNYMTWVDMGLIKFLKE